MPFDSVSAEELWMACCPCFQEAQKIRGDAIFIAVGRMLFCTSGGEVFQLGKAAQEYFREWLPRHVKY